MRQTHPAGERLFVDYAGDTVPVFDQITNAERPAHIFVAALGASNYTYAEARWSEGLGDWVSAHVNALATIGGVPKAVVCDNLKAGVTKPSRYEPGSVRLQSEQLSAFVGIRITSSRLVEMPTDITDANPWRCIVDGEINPHAEIGRRSVRWLGVILTIAVLAIDVECASGAGQLTFLDRFGLAAAFNVLPPQPDWNGFSERSFL